MSLSQANLIDQAKNEQLDKYLIFVVADEAYGIAIQFVTEIIGIQPVNTLPEVPDYIKGVINLRGRIIPVVDMHVRLGKKEAVYTNRTCIVVVETTRITAGLIVDLVSEVIVIDEADIVPPPDVQAPDCRRYVSGIGKVESGIKLLIDCEKLFDSSDVQSNREL